MAASRITGALKSAPTHPRTRYAGGRGLPAQISHIVKTAAKRADLPSEVSPHWLRHVHASYALDCDAPISLVQATLYHTSVQTTGRFTRAHPNDSSSRDLP